MVQKLVYIEINILSKVIPLKLFDNDIDSDNKKNTIYLFSTF